MVMKCRKFRDYPEDHLRPNVGMQEETPTKWWRLAHLPPKKPTPEGWIGASRAGHPQPSLQRRTNFPASQKNTMSKMPWQRIYRTNWWNLEAWEFWRMIIWTNLEEFSMKDHRSLVRLYIEKGDKRNARNSHKLDSSTKLVFFEFGVLPIWI